LISSKYKLPDGLCNTIIDPKQRRISAAPFRDRVVHHVLCNLIEPVFEKTFIRDSFANRKKKGAHKAIECYQQFAKLFPCVLKCDIRKFFPSLDHAVLKQEICRKIGCQDTLWLCDTIPQNRVVQKGKVKRYRRWLKKKVRQMQAGNLPPDRLENA
jgi:retron-type reverse transcriptase